MKRKHIIIIIALLFLAFITTYRFVEARRITAEYFAPIRCEEYYYIKDYAKCKVEKEWDVSQWHDFHDLVAQESRNWTVNGAHYPSGYTVDGIKSSAHGLGGFLDGTWASTGYKKTDNMRTQVKATIIYIRNNYDTPQKAWRIHRIQDWY